MSPQDEERLIAWVNSGAVMTMRTVLRLDGWSEGRYQIPPAAWDWTHCGMAVECVGRDPVGSPRALAPLKSDYAVGDIATVNGVDMFDLDRVAKPDAVEQWLADQTSDDLPAGVELCVVNPTMNTAGRRYDTFTAWRLMNRFGRQRALAHLAGHLDAPSVSTWDTEAGGVIFEATSSLELAEAEPVSWLIGDLMEADGLTMMYGPSGSGKSFMALDMCLSVCHGRPFFGRDTVAGPVLYLATEGHSGLKDRVEAWHAYHGLQDNGRLLVSETLIDLSSARLVDEIASFAAELSPRLVVLDTLAKGTGGELDEQSAKDMTKVTAALARIAQSSPVPCAVLMVHHSGKDASKGARGSSALKAGVDTELSVTGDAQAINMRLTKQKNAALPDEAWNYRLHEVDLDEGRSGAVVVSHDLDGGGRGKARHLRTLRILRDYATTEGLTRASIEAASTEDGGANPMSRPTVGRALNGLEASGLVERVGRWAYRITDEGRSRLDAAAADSPGSDST